MIEYALCHSPRLNSVNPESLADDSTCIQLKKHIAGTTLKSKMPQCLGACRLETHVVVQRDPEGSEN
jgi:hypothetical protein